MITKIPAPSCGLRPLLASLIFCLFFFEGYSSQLVVRPPDGKVGKEQVLIFLPGARVPAVAGRGTITGFPSNGG